MNCDWRWPGLLAGLLMTLCLSSQLVIAEDVESPKDDIAAQIRAQGYACDEGASYRVRLIPDVAAQVEPINQ
jgi:hypothetical protein